ncbi:MAG: AI-2E family transporter [Desulfobulbaceae bacterium]|jgi:predicted PurR-regulated permease PerM|nr:AI-2E family transporter [Desulfobulbaceae bacterium]
MTQQRPSNLILTYFLILFLLSALLLARLFFPFASILILSYLLSSISEPVFVFLKKKLPPSFASLVTCSLIVLLVFVPLVFFVAALSSEAYNLLQVTKGTNLAKEFTTYIQSSTIFIRLEALLTGYGINISMAEVSSSLSEFGTEVARFIYTQASIWAANIIGFVFHFIMMILIIFYLLLEKEKLVTFFLHLSPLPNNHNRLLIRKFEKITSAILVGNGICGVIQGVIGGLVFSFLGFTSPFLWGGVMGILAFLPIAGVGAVLIPASIILIIRGDILQGVGLAFFYLILSMSVEYFLKPKLVGDQVRMHIILVFLAIIGGLRVFGVLGIIYGPLIITGFLTLADIYIDNYEQYVTSKEEE